MKVLFTKGQAHKGEYYTPELVVRLKNQDAALLAKRKEEVCILDLRGEVSCLMRNRKLLIICPSVGSEGIIALIGPSSLLTSC